MTAPYRLGVLALIALTLAACQRPSTDDAAFGARVRAYLLAHPEVLQEVSQKLDAKLADQAASRQRQAESLLPRLRSSVERDPLDFVANPKGVVTVTEFYDYRCPHCVSVAPKVIALIRAHPDVRVVFKETPIFGATSEHAARAALAVARSGGDSLGLYQALMSARGLDDATIDRLARAEGAKPADLTPEAAKAADAHLSKTSALFAQLDLEGTPAFIVGDQIILGEDMDAVTAAVAKARAGSSPSGPRAG
jgi:protein-disulfide isomerase